MNNARWMTDPRTEAEWDLYVTRIAPQFHQCLWLAVNMPAKRVRRQRLPSAAGEDTT